jgi:hypothetical protein
MILLLSVAENEFQSDPHVFLIPDPLSDRHSCNVPFRSGKFLFAVLRIGPGLTSAVGRGMRLMN